MSLTTALLKLPTVHGRHTRVPIVTEGEYPGTQLHVSTDTLPGTDTAYAGQSLHTGLAPVENVFSGQSTHTVESVALLYLPAAQFAHVLRSPYNMYPGTHLHVLLYTR